MSDNARDLLIHGIAAVKANSKDEARHYLEWVLLTDANLEQETDAWYWLSQITDDPAEKRTCLENVLAAYPKHPEARRDLAILEGRLNPHSMRNQLYAATPVATAATLQEDDVQRFLCPKCGGRMTFDAGKGGLFCQFCGYTQAGEILNDGNGASGTQVQEQDWIAAIYTDRGHRWELPMQRTLNCGGCGATVTLLPSHISTECPFCGSSVVVTEQSGELIQPIGGVPFAFNSDAALVHARRFLREQKFCPADLSEHAIFVPARPVYLPFWTFDISGEITWVGQIPESELGRVRMVPTSGIINSFYDEILVPGTKSLPEEHLSDLKYDMQALVPYSPGLLADWPAEIYTIPLADAAVIAHSEAYKQSAFEATLQLEQGSMGVVLESRVTNVDLAVLSYKHVLLPVWVTSYTYKGDQHTLIVNGQNGESQGSVPRNGFQSFLGEVFGED